MECSGLNISNSYVRRTGFEPCAFGAVDRVFDPFVEGVVADSVEFSNTNKASELEGKFLEIKSKQGVVGKAWDGIKNKLNMKYASNQVADMIKCYKIGLVDEETALKAVNKYANGQKKALDFVADWGSMLVGAAAFTVSLPLLASGLPAALGCAALGGALFKTSAKFIDAKTGNREYKTAPYDVVTGAINGFLSPIVNGVGNAVIKGAAGKLGIKATAKAASNAKGLITSFANVGEVISHFALYPKQALEGGLLKSGIAYTTGKAVRSVTKYTLALGLRELAFDVFSRDAVSLSGMKIARSPLTILLSPDKKKEFEETIDAKSKASEIDFSNDVYGVESKPDKGPEENQG